MEDRILGLTLPACVRIAKARLTPAELEAQRSKGKLTVTPLKPVELVVGGAVVATGTVAEKDGRTIFTVEDVK